MIAERRVVLSERTQSLDNLKCAHLLVVSPDHGSVEYRWERKDVLEWVHVKVPSDTCLLYARCQGMYRCLVAGDVYNFEVTSTGMQVANACMPIS